MLAGRRIQINLMPPTVEDCQFPYQAHIKSFPREVAEDCMANLRPFKHLYVLSVNFQFHFPSSIEWRASSGHRSAQPHPQKHGQPRS